MNLPKIALLPDRAVVAVEGADAGKLLQGLLTNDIGPLAAETSSGPRPAVHASLLSAQGKILFDFIVFRPMQPGEGAGEALYLLETAKDRAGDLVNRLGMYRLRAAVTITVEEPLAVAAIWDASTTALEAVLPRASDSSPMHVRDPRHARLGLRWLSHSSIVARTVAAAVRAGKAVEARPEDYHAHRIALGIPEAGRDYDLGDTFPHEANLDLLAGVDFAKGCFIGQEVVSRMQHKSVVRKRVVPVTADGDLPTDRPDIIAGPATIGRLGSVAGRTGLALMRLDRAAEAIAAGTPIVAGGATLTVDAAAMARYLASVAERGEATP